jgi:hypothetical protein
MSGGAALHKKTMISNPDMIDKMTAQSAAVGTENLLNILKNFARVDGD